MDKDIILARHSVRQYSDKPLDNEHIKKLNEAIEKCNTGANLNIQLILNEPKAFSGILAHYGNFKGVMNYFAMIGPKSEDLEQRIGYQGEKLVLLAQQLGLNTCWVGGTFQKISKAVKMNRDDKFVMVIAVGYGLTQGSAHHSKPIEEFANFDGTPEWFRNGVEYVMLCPSALNKQNFNFEYNNGKALITSTGHYSEINKGIAMLHFELGAGVGPDIWKQLNF